MPAEGPRRWLYLNALRQHVERGTLPKTAAKHLVPFFSVLPPEQRQVLLVGLAERWIEAGLKPELVKATEVA